MYEFGEGKSKLKGRYMWFGPDGDSFYVPAQPVCPVRSSWLPKILFGLALVVLFMLGRCSAQEASVHSVAHAIARAEGFYVKGTIPNRLNNPGDITASRAHQYPGQVGRYKSYAVFKSDRYGWAALEAQIQKIIDGTSSHYNQAMTFVQIGRVYAENATWGKVVCKILNISPQLTFQEYFGLAPRVRFTYATPMWLFDSGGRAMPTLSEVQPMQAHLRGTSRWVVETLPYFEMVEGD